MTNHSFNRENFIAQNFNLGPIGIKGWRKNLSTCPYCRDGSSKNPRSYFLFTDDGIGFQCFNCGRKHKFTETNVQSLAGFVHKISWKSIGKLVLEITQLKLFPKKTKKEKVETETEEETENIDYSLIDYKEIDLPEKTFKLSAKAISVPSFYRKSFKENKKKAKEYFEERGLDWKLQKAYICLSGEYKNRLIIPIKFNNKLVSFAARALFPTKNKYLYPPSSEEYNNRGQIIFGLDKLFESTEVKRIFVFESIVDAILFDGMAILSKNITQEQLDIITTFNFQKKELIFVLDNDKINFKSKEKDLKGLALGKRILDLNEEHLKVSYPKFREAKDLSESYSKHGFLETFDCVMDGIYENNTLLDLNAKLRNASFLKTKKFNSFNK